MEISSKIVDSLDETFVLKRLQSKDYLTEVRKAQSDCKVLLEKSQDFLALVSKIIDACHLENRGTLETALSRLLFSRVSEDIVLNAIDKDKIQIPDVNRELKQVIPVAYSSEREKGTFEIGLLRSETTFGYELEKYTLLKAKCLRLVQLIEYLDFVKLKQFFTDIRSLAEIEITRAREIKPDLDNILDENSRWEFEIYIANLGNTPFLVSVNSTLYVKSEILAEFEELCHLEVITEQNDGARRIAMTDSPIVIGKEEGVLFAYMTENTQGKMKRGKVFRDEFVTGNGQCWIEIPIEKTGLLRHAKLTTPKVKFCTSNRGD